MTLWNEDLALFECAVLLTIDGEEAFTDHMLMHMTNVRSCPCRV